MQILADPTLRPFFDGVNMANQKQHQIKFMTMAFGGPNDYTGPDIAAAHQRLIEQKGLDASHFDRVAGHLVGTLRVLGVKKPLIDEVVAIVGPLRSIFEVAAANVAAAKSLEATATTAPPEPTISKVVRRPYFYTLNVALNYDPSLRTWMMNRTRCSPASEGRRPSKLPLTSSTRRSWPT